MKFDGHFLNLVDNLNYTYKIIIISSKNYSKFGGQLFFSYFWADNFPQISEDPNNEIASKTKESLHLIFWLKVNAIKPW